MPVYCKWNIRGHTWRCNMFNGVQPGQPVERRKEFKASGSENKPFRLKNGEKECFKKKQQFKRKQLNLLCSASWHWTIKWNRNVDRNPHRERICAQVCVQVCFPSSQRLVSPEHYRVVRLPFSPSSHSVYKKLHRLAAGVTEAFIKIRMIPDENIFHWKSRFHADYVANIQGADTNWSTGASL